MYSQTYSFIRDILHDDELNDYIFNLTGKHLAIIDAGAQITSPAVKIIFNGGTITRASNTKQEVAFILSFAMPFWGNNAFSDCLHFLEVIIPICLQYSSDNGSFISSVTPSIVEKENDNNFWLINLNLSINTFI